MGDVPASSHCPVTLRTLETRGLPWHTPRVRPCLVLLCCRSHPCSSLSEGECSSTAHTCTRMSAHEARAMVLPPWHSGVCVTHASTIVGTLSQKTVTQTQCWHSCCNPRRRWGAAHLQRASQDVLCSRHGPSHAAPCTAP